MCGIVGAVASRNVPAILLAGLQRLEYRGYDSAGIAVLDGTNPEIQRRRTVGGVKELVESLNGAPIHGITGIAHTAQPRSRRSRTPIRTCRAVASAWSTTASSRTTRNCATNCSMPDSSSSPTPIRNSSRI